MPDWAAQPHVTASVHGLGGPEALQTEGRWVLNSIRQTAQMRVCAVLQRVPASTVTIYISLPAGQLTREVASLAAMWGACGLSHVNIRYNLPATTLVGAFSHQRKDG